MQQSRLERLAFVGDTALELTNDPLAIEGFNDLLDLGGPKDTLHSNEVGTEDGTVEIEGGPQGGPDHLEATAEEAATALGISVRAVLKRLNKGTLRGRKIATKFGEKWLVDREELPKTIHVEMAAQGSPKDGPASQEGGTEDGTSSAQDGPQDGPLNYANQFALAQSLSNQNELIATVLKQAQIIEQLTNDVRQKDEHIRLLTDSQRKGWWTRFSSWFFGTRK